MGTFMTGNDEKCLNLSVNNSKNKRRIGLKLCLLQCVMEANLFLQYQRNRRISNFFCGDLTWNYPTVLFPHHWGSYLSLMLEIEKQSYELNLPLIGHYTDSASNSLTGLVKLASKKT